MQKVSRVNGKTKINGTQIKYEKEKNKEAA